jgi:hypothetical protein
VSSKCKECEILIDAMFFCCKSLYSVSVANCTGTKSSSLTRSDTICIDFSIFLPLGLFLLGRGVSGAEISPKFDLKNVISTYTKDFSGRNWPKFARFQRKINPIRQIFMIYKDSEFFFYYYIAKSD